MKTNSRTNAPSNAADWRTDLTTSGAGRTRTTDGLSSAAPVPVRMRSEASVNTTGVARGSPVAGTNASVRGDSHAHRPATAGDTCPGGLAYTSVGITSASKCHRTTALGATVALSPGSNDSTRRVPRCSAARWRSHASRPPHAATLAAAKQATTIQNLRDTLGAVAAVDMPVLLDCARTILRAR